VIGSREYSTVDIEDIPTTIELQLNCPLGSISGRELFPTSQVQTSLELRSKALFLLLPLYKKNNPTLLST